MITGKELFGEIKQKKKSTFLCSLGEVFFLKVVLVHSGTMTQMMRVTCVHIQKAEAFQKFDVMSHLQFFSSFP